jgi:hypothetical protein
MLNARAFLLCAHALADILTSTPHPTSPTPSHPHHHPTFLTMTMTITLIIALILILSFTLTHTPIHFTPPTHPHIHTLYPTHTPTHPYTLPHPLTHTHTPYPTHTPTHPYTFPCKRLDLPSSPGDFSTTKSRANFTMCSTLWRAGRSSCRGWLRSSVLERADGQWWGMHQLRQHPLPHSRRHLRLQRRRRRRRRSHPARQALQANTGRRPARRRSTSLPRRCRAFCARRLHRRMLLRKHHPVALTKRRL